MSLITPVFTVKLKPLYDQIITINTIFSIVDDVIDYIHTDSDSTVFTFASSDTSVFTVNEVDGTLQILKPSGYANLIVTMAASATYDSASTSVLLPIVNSVNINSFVDLTYLTDGTISTSANKGWTAASIQGNLNRFHWVDDLGALKGSMVSNIPPTSDTTRFYFQMITTNTQTLNSFRFIRNAFSDASYAYGKIQLRLKYVTGYGYLSFSCMNTSYGSYDSALVQQIATNEYLYETQLFQPISTLTFAFTVPANSPNVECYLTDFRIIFPPAGLSKPLPTLACSPYLDASRDNVAAQPYVANTMTRFGGASNFKIITAFTGSYLNMMTTCIKSTTPSSYVTFDLITLPLIAFSNQSNANPVFGRCMVTLYTNKTLSELKSNFTSYQVNFCSPLDSTVFASFDLVSLTNLLYDSSRGLYGTELCFSLLSGNTQSFQNGVKIVYAITGSVNAIFTDVTFYMEDLQFFPEQYDATALTLTSTNSTVDISLFDYECSDPSALSLDNTTGNVTVLADATDVQLSYQYNGLKGRYGLGACSSDLFQTNTTTLLNPFANNDNIALVSSPLHVSDLVNLSSLVIPNFAANADTSNSFTLFAPDIFNNGCLVPTTNTNEFTLNAISSSFVLLLSTSSPISSGFAPRTMAVNTSILMNDRVLPFTSNSINVAYNQTVSWDSLFSSTFASTIQNASLDNVMPVITYTVLVNSTPTNTLTATYGDVNALAQTAIVENYTSNAQPMNLTFDGSSFSAFKSTYTGLPYGSLHAFTIRFVWAASPSYNAATLTLTVFMQTGTTPTTYDFAPFINKLAVNGDSVTISKATLFSAFSSPEQFALIDVDNSTSGPWNVTTSPNPSSLLSVTNTAGNITLTPATNSGSVTLSIQAIAWINNAYTKNLPFTLRTAPVATWLSGAPSLRYGNTRAFLDFVDVLGCDYTWSIQSGGVLSSDGLSVTVNTVGDPLVLSVTLDGSQTTSTYGLKTTSLSFDVLPKITTTLLDVQLYSIHASQQTLSIYTDLIESINTDSDTLDFTFASSDDTVFTVDMNTLTCTIVNYGGSASFIVTANESDQYTSKQTSVPLMFSHLEITTTPEQIQAQQASVALISNDRDYSVYNITFTSSDTNVATILSSANNTCVVQFVTFGSVVVYADLAAVDGYSAVHDNTRVQATQFQPTITFSIDQPYVASRDLTASYTKTFSSNDPSFTSVSFSSTLDPTYITLDTSTGAFQLAGMLPSTVTNVDLTATTPATTWCLASTTTVSRPVFQQMYFGGCRIASSTSDAITTDLSTADSTWFSFDDINNIFVLQPYYFLTQSTLPVLMFLLDASSPTLPSGNSLVDNDGVIYSFTLSSGVSFPDPNYLRIENFAAYSAVNTNSFTTAFWINPIDAFPENRVNISVQCRAVDATVTNLPSFSDVEYTATNAADLQNTPFTTVTFPLPTFTTSQVAVLSSNTAVARVSSVNLAQGTFDIQYFQPGNYSITFQDLGDNTLWLAPSTLQTVSGKVVNLVDRAPYFQYTIYDLELTVNTFDISQWIEIVTDSSGAITFTSLDTNALTIDGNNQATVLSTASDIYIRVSIAATTDFNNYTEDILLNWTTQYTQPVITATDVNFSTAVWPDNQSATFQVAQQLAGYGARTGATWSVSDSSNVQIISSNDTQCSLFFSQPGSYTLTVSYDVVDVVIPAESTTLSFEVLKQPADITFTPANSYFEITQLSTDNTTSLGPFGCAVQTTNSDPGLLVFSSSKPAVITDISYNYITGEFYIDVNRAQMQTTFEDIYIQASLAATTTVAAYNNTQVLLLKIRKSMSNSFDTSRVETSLGTSAFANNTLTCVLAEATTNFDLSVYLDQGGAGLDVPVNLYCTSFAILPDFLQSKINNTWDTIPLQTNLQNTVVSSPWQKCTFQGKNIPSPGSQSIRVDIVAFENTILGTYVEAASFTFTLDIQPMAYQVDAVSSSIFNNQYDMSNYNDLMQPFFSNTPSWPSIQQIPYAVSTTPLDPASNPNGSWWVQAFNDAPPTLSSSHPLSTAFFSALFVNADTFAQSPFQTSTSLPSFTNRLQGRNAVASFNAGQYLLGNYAVNQKLHTCSNFTFSTWFLCGPFNATEPAQQTIFRFTDLDQNRECHLFINNTSSQKQLMFRYLQNNAIQIQIASDATAFDNVCDMQWHHVTCTMDASQFQVIVDGNTAQPMISYANPTFLFSSVFTSVAQSTFGATFQSNTVSNGFLGALADIFMFDFVLDAEQIGYLARPSLSSAVLQVMPSTTDPTSFLINEYTPIANFYAEWLFVPSDIRWFVPLPTLSKPEITTSSSIQKYNTSLFTDNTLPTDQSTISIRFQDTPSQLFTPLPIYNNYSITVNYTTNPSTLLAFDDAHAPTRINYGVSHWVKDSQTATLTATIPATELYEQSQLVSTVYVKFNDTQLLPPVFDPEGSSPFSFATWNDVDQAYHFSGAFQELIFHFEVPYQNTSLIRVPTTFQFVANAPTSFSWLTTQTAPYEFTANEFMTAGPLTLRLALPEIIDTTTGCTLSASSTDFSFIVDPVTVDPIASESLAFVPTTLLYSDPSSPDLPFSMVTYSTTQFMTDNNLVHIDQIQIVSSDDTVVSVSWDATNIVLQFWKEGHYTLTFSVLAYGSYLASSMDTIVTGQVNRNSDLQIVFNSLFTQFNPPAVFNFADLYQSFFSRNSNPVTVVSEDPSIATVSGNFLSFTLNTFPPWSPIDTIWFNFSQAQDDVYLPVSNLRVGIFLDDLNVYPVVTPIDPNWSGSVSFQQNLYIDFQISYQSSYSGPRPFDLPADTANLSFTTIDNTTFRVNVLHVGSGVANFTVTFPMVSDPVILNHETANFQFTVLKGETTLSFETPVSLIAFPSTANGDIIGFDFPPIVCNRPDSQILTYLQTGVTYNPINALYSINVSDKNVSATFYRINLSIYGSTVTFVVSLSESSDFLFTSFSNTIEVRMKQAQTLQPLPQNSNDVFATFSNVNYQFAVTPVINNFNTTGYLTVQTDCSTHFLGDIYWPLSTNYYATTTDKNVSIQDFIGQGSISISWSFDEQTDPISGIIYEAISTTTFNYIVSKDTVLLQDAPTITSIVRNSQNVTYSLPTAWLQHLNVAAPGSFDVSSLDTDVATIQTIQPGDTTFTIDYSNVIGSTDITITFMPDSSISNLVTVTPIVQTVYLTQPPDIDSSTWTLPSSFTILDSNLFANDYTPNLTDGNFYTASYWSFSSSDNTILDFGSDSRILIKNIGTVTVTFTLTVNDTQYSSNFITKSVSVVKTAPTIEFNATAFSGYTFDDVDQAVSFENMVSTNNPDTALVYTSDNTNVIDITSDVNGVIYWTPKSVGQTFVTAFQASTVFFNENSIDIPITIAKAVPRLVQDWTIPVLNTALYYNNIDITMPVINSTGAVTLSSTSPYVLSISTTSNPPKVSFPQNTAAAVTFTATVAETTNYLSTSFDTTWQLTNDKMTYTLDWSTAWLTEYSCFDSITQTLNATFSNTSYPISLLNVVWTVPEGLTLTSLNTAHSQFTLQFDAPGDYALTGTIVEQHEYVAGTISATIHVLSASFTFSDVVLPVHREITNLDPIELLLPDTTGLSDYGRTQLVVNYTSSNTSVATISWNTDHTQAFLQPVSAGTTTITTSTVTDTRWNAQTNIVSFQIYKSVFESFVSYSLPTIATQPGAQKNLDLLSLLVDLPIPTNSSVTFVTTNPLVATVNSTSGLVTFVSSGTAFIDINISETDIYLTNSRSISFSIAKSLPTFQNVPSTTLTVDKYYDAAPSFDQIVSNSDATLQFQSNHVNILDIDSSGGTTFGEDEGLVTITISLVQTALFLATTQTILIQVNKTPNPLTLTQSVFEVYFSSTAFVPSLTQIINTDQPVTLSIESDVNHIVNLSTDQTELILQNNTIGSATISVHQLQSSSVSTLVPLSFELRLLPIVPVFSSDLTDQNFDVTFGQSTTYITFPSITNENILFPDDIYTRTVVVASELIATVNASTGAIEPIGEGTTTATIHWTSNNLCYSSSSQFITITIYKATPTFELPDGFSTLQSFNVTITNADGSATIPFVPSFTGFPPYELPNFSISFIDNNNIASYDVDTQNVVIQYRDFDVTTMDFQLVITFETNAYYIALDPIQVPFHVIAPSFSFVYLISDTFANNNDPVVEIQSTEIVLRPDQSSIANTSSHFKSVHAAQNIRQMIRMSK